MESETNNSTYENKILINNEFSTFSNEDSEDDSNPFEFITNEKEECTYRIKAQEIEKFLERNNDLKYSELIDTLRNFALSKGGLINDDIRRLVWPLLLNINPKDIEPLINETDFKKHHEFSQVALDVNRSIKRFPPGIPYDQRVAMQDQLISLILRVIDKYPQLQYYQGYHDVAITFLLVVGENMAFHIMEKLSINHLKHFMEPTMEKTSEMLEYIFPLLEHIHPSLFDYIEMSEVGSMFALPWFLTWYSHTLTKYENVMRLYDYFLASDPPIPLYLIPIILVHRQDILFATECEMSALHQVLSELPDDLPYDDLLQEATNLYNKYPPADIEKEVILRREKKKAELEERRKMFSLRNNNIPINKNNLNRAAWKLVHRVIPDWFIPQSTLRFLLYGAGFFVGLYAYYRY